MRARICPALRASTASGLMIANVFSIFLRRVSRPASTSTSATERLSHLAAHVGRTLRDVDAGLRERVHLFSGSPLSAGDDCTGVAHAAPRRRRLSGDKSNYGFSELAGDERRGFLLRSSPDLSDHDDGFSV